jgi:hypothetical protein
MCAYISQDLTSLWFLSPKFCKHFIKHYFPCTTDITENVTKKITSELKQSVVVIYISCTSLVKLAIGKHLFFLGVLHVSHTNFHF